MPFGLTLILLGYAVIHPSHAESPYYQMAVDPASNQEAVAPAGFWNSAPQGTYFQAPNRYLQAMYQRAVIGMPNRQMLQNNAAAGPFTPVARSYMASPVQTNQMAPVMSNVNPYADQALYAAFQAQQNQPYLNMAGSFAPARPIAMNQQPAASAKQPEMNSQDWTQMVEERKRRDQIARMNQAARRRNVYLDSIGSDPYGPSSSVVSRQNFRLAKHKRSARH